MDLFWEKKNEIIKKNSLGPNVPLPLFTSLASFSFTLMVVCSLFISVSLCLYRRRRLVLASMSRSSVCEREWHWRNHTFDSEHKHTHTHYLYVEQLDSLCGLNQSSGISKPPSHHSPNSTPQDFVSFLI